jgi:PIN domain nuclease of toxin-antitoxin system
MLVLDTHALIWAHKGIRIAKKVERRIMAAAGRHELYVSAITPWEIALGVRRGRIRVAGDVLEWIEAALDALGCAVGSRSDRSSSRRSRSISCRSRSFSRVTSSRGAAHHRPAIATGARNHISASGSTTRCVARG